MSSVDNYLDRWGRSAKPITWGLALGLVGGFLFSIGQGQATAAALDLYSDGGAGQPLMLIGGALAFGGAVAFIVGVRILALNVDMLAADVAGRLTREASEDRARRQLDRAAAQRRDNDEED